MPEADNVLLAEAGLPAGKDVLHNWSGIKNIARKNQIFYPKTEAEVSLLIQNAKSKVHVIGSGLSYENLMSLPLDDDEAILLSLRNFNGLLRLTDTSATFAAATTVNEVVATLAKLDRMMTCSLGVIGMQTLAGAISTGTHGQGLFQSDYATTVKSLKVVLPNGDILTVASNDTDLPLNAFVTSLGTLGVILEIEIRTESRRIFVCQKVAFSYEDFLEKYEAWNQDYEYVKVWWFPETELCQVWLLDEATPSQSKAFLSTDRAAPIKLSNETDSLNATVEKYIQAMSLDTKASGSADKPQFQTLRRFADATDLVGYQEQILCKGIPVPQINCEIAIPSDRFQEATEALHGWSKAHPGKIHYPFIYRTTGQSSAWLSAASSGPVVWIGFLVYLAEDGTVRSDGLETMRILQLILQQYDGLPHWGKHFSEIFFQFECLLKQFLDFRQLRRRLDPEQKMLSRYLEGIFL